MLPRPPDAGPSESYHVALGSSGDHPGRIIAEVPACLAEFARLIMAFKLVKSVQARCRVVNAPRRVAPRYASGRGPSIEPRSSGTNWASPYERRSAGSRRSSTARAMP